MRDNINEERQRYATDPFLAVLRKEFARAVNMAVPTGYVVNGKVEVGYDKYSVEKIQYLIDRIIEHTNHSYPNLC